MTKNALNYATESLKWYEENSPFNPRNSKNPLMKQETDAAIEFRAEQELKWTEQYNQQKIITYLETILERLPYELPKDKKK